MNNKKYTLSIILCVFLLAAFITSINVSGKNNEIKKIVVSGDSTFPPYEYIDEYENHKGFNVELIQAISIEKGFNVHYVPMIWDDAIKALEEEKIDAIIGMVRSKDREEKFDFTKGIVDYSQVIFVRKDTAYINSLKDLVGLKVSIQKGDIGEELVSPINNIEIIEKENQNEALKALISGEVDAFVGNRLSGLYNIQKNKFEDKVKIVGKQIKTRDYGIAVIKGNDDLVNLLNEGLNAVKEDKIYEKIYYKWFGETFYNAKSFYKKITIVLLLCVIVTLSISFIYIYINKRLKKIIEEKTEKLIEANEELQMQQEELQDFNMELELQQEALLNSNRELEVMNNKLSVEIKEREAAEEAIKHSANHDYLTDLPNRKYFTNKVKEIIEEYSSTDLKFALLFLDVDKFKSINDTYGHYIGDVVLKEIAFRMKENIPDDKFPARLGGDEFIILLPEILNTEYAVDFAKKVNKIINEPISVDNIIINLSVSIGISIFPHNGKNVDELLKKADSVMYEAKTKGGNRHCI